jgi:hypothetical protein
MAAFQDQIDMRHLCVTIPAGVEFADLCLSRHVDTGQVHFDLTPIAAICEASNLNLAEIVQGSKPLVALVIAAWYVAHIERGGAPDPVQESLMDEVRLEMERESCAYLPGPAAR